MFERPRRRNLCLMFLMFEAPRLRPCCTFILKQRVLDCSVNSFNVISLHLNAISGVGEVFILQR